MRNRAEDEFMSKIIVPNDRLDSDEEDKSESPRNIGRAFPRGLIRRPSSTQSLLGLNFSMGSVGSGSMQRITLDFIGPVIGSRRDCELCKRKPTKSSSQLKKMKVRHAS